MSATTNSPPVDCHFDTIGADTWHDKHENLALGFQDIDGRLPAASREADRIGLKNSRCSRSARASISHACDHIQFRIRSRSIGVACRSR
jgi:hypothetical protein